MANYLGALAPYLGAAAEAAAAREEQRRARSAPRGLAGIDMFRDPGRAPGRDPGMLAPYLAAAAAAQGPGPFPLAIDTGNPPSLLDLIQAGNPTRDPRQAMAPGQQGRDPGMLAPYLGPAQPGGPESMVPGFQAAQPGRPQTNDPGYGASRAMVDDPAYDPSAPPYATSLATAGAPGGSAGPGSVPGGYVGDPGARPPELNVEGLPWNPAETNVEGLPWLGETEVEGLPWLQGNSEMQALIADLMGGGDAESDKWGALGQGFAAMADSPFFLSGLAKGAGTAMSEMEKSKAEATKRKIAGAGLLQDENTQAERVRSAQASESQGRERIGLEGQSLEERIRSAKAGEAEARRGNNLTAANAARGRALQKIEIDLRRQGLVPNDDRMIQALEDRGFPRDEAVAMVMTKGRGNDQSVYRERVADLDRLRAGGMMTDPEYYAQLKGLIGEAPITPIDIEKMVGNYGKGLGSAYINEPEKFQADLNEYRKFLYGVSGTPLPPQFGGVPDPTGTPAPGAPAPGGGAGDAEVGLPPAQKEMLDNARDAIRRGADPAKVRERLKGIGIDPSLLGA